jgi:hypothetical protein
MLLRHHGKRFHSTVHLPRVLHFTSIRMQRCDLNELNFNPTRHEERGRGAS